MLKVRIPGIAMFFCLFVTLFSLSETLHTYAAPIEAPEVNEENVTDFMEDFLQSDVAEHIPGGVIVIVKGDRVIYKKGFGYANQELKKRMNPDETLLRIASVSKPITATALLQLVEKGLVRLNDPVDMYVGSNMLKNETDGILTVEHLLTHTTGFDFPDGKVSDIDFDLNRRVSLEDHIFHNMPTIIRKPGTSFMYDNYAALLQGYIVQKVTGMPFHDYVQKHVFEPLGMKDSSYILTEELKGRMATGYKRSGKPVPLYTTVPWDSPDGSMITTGADMAQFMLAHLNKGILGKARILEESTIESMHRPQLRINDQVPAMSYGFEYTFHSKNNGYQVISKAGDLDGTASILWMIPNQRVGVFFSFNQSSFIIGEDARVKLFDAFMDRFYPNASQKYPDNDSNGTDTKIYEGTYRDLRMGTWLFEVKGTGKGQLKVNETMLGTHLLREVAPDTFIDESQRLLAFQRLSDGQIAFMQYINPVGTAEKLIFSNKYIDIEQGHKDFRAIDFLSKLGIDFSNSSEMFEPEKHVTRSEFAEALMKILKLPETVGTSVLSDVKGHPREKVIETLYTLGLLNGRTQNEFMPDTPITWSEASVILWRTLQEYPYLLNHPILPIQLDPKERIEGHWANEANQLILERGFYKNIISMNGSAVIDWDGNRNLTRSEAARVLYHLAHPFKD